MSQTPLHIEQLPASKPAFPWKKVLLEIVTIALGITLGFGLERWNDNRREKIAEAKILLEMRNGLLLDQKDIQDNKMGHEIGLKAIDYYRRLVLGKPVGLDSFYVFHKSLFRGFVAIQNTTAYESLKSGGLETITNDSLRFRIVSLYDFDYQILFKLEETYPETQFMPLYFNELMRIFSPFHAFDANGNLIGIQSVKLSEKDRAYVLTILDRMQLNRDFLSIQYEAVLQRVESLAALIEKELAK